MKPFVCPVCGGNGLVPNGFYNQVNGSWLSSSTVPETCRSCNGSGVTWDAPADEEIKTLIQKKDNAYQERDKCVSLIARMALALGLKAGLGRHPDEDTSWEDDWRNIVYIDLPSGQVSWHIHDAELPMFSFLSVYKGKWDGHDTEEKYRRVLEPGKIFKGKTPTFAMFTGMMTIPKAISCIFFGIAIGVFWGTIIFMASMK